MSIAAHAEAIRRVPAPARTRVRFAVTAAILVFASTVSLLLLNLLAARYPARVDVTATREQELSPRTQALVSALPGAYEIVIAADWSGLDPRAARRVRDVLDLLARSSRRLTTTTIDTTTAAGQASYKNLLERLAERDAPAIRSHLTVVNAAIDAARSASDSMGALATRFPPVREAIPSDAHGAEANRRYFEHQASQLRVNAETLARIADSARETLGKVGALGAPDVDAAATPLRKNLADLEAGLRAVASSVRAFAEAPEMPADARALAAPLAHDVSRLRDAVAVHADALARLPKLDSVRVARTLQAAQAALVIGPPEAGLTAIPFDWLFPAGETLDASGESRADMRRRNEELFATALDSLARPVNPIVVLMHPWPPPPLLDRQRGLEKLVERLGLRGIDVVEWPVAEQPEPPSLAALDPKNQRPVVYATFNFDTTSGTASGRTGPERAEALATALARIVEEGRPILLSTIPSALPTFGSPDRTVSFLNLFGLSADTARPLMRDALSPAGRVVLPEFQLLASESGPPHPISGAVRALRTHFEWPVPLAVLPESEAPRARVWPLFTVDDKAAWAESEWLSLWQATAGGGRRAPPAQNLPQPDASRDDRGGRWVVAAAAERALPQGGGSQRLVLVGSNSWFTDRVTLQQARLVDGRVAIANPGNVELFESAVSWLAGQDDRIGASATARAVPVIRPLAPGTLGALRWAVILGLPALTLAAGLMWRVWRG